MVRDIFLFRLSDVTRDGRLFLRLSIWQKIQLFGMNLFGRRLGARDFSLVTLLVPLIDAKLSGYR